MPKGAYKVSDNYVGPSKDGSFRSCLCAMLIFAAICGSILLIAHLVKTSGSKKEEPNTGDSLGTADEQKGNKFHNPKDNEALKPIVTTTTKPIKIYNTTTEPHATKESATVANEVDISAEVFSGVVTQDPSVQFAKFQENNKTNVLTSNITDNSEEKSETETPLTSTVLPEGNELTTEQTLGKNTSSEDSATTETSGGQATIQAEEKSVTKTESVDNKEESTTEPIDKSKIQQPVDNQTKNVLTEPTKQGTTESTLGTSTTKQPAYKQTTEQMEDETITEISNDDISTTNEIDKATTLESKDVTTTKNPKGILVGQETTNQQKNPTTSEKPTDKPKEQPTTETTENMTVTKSPNDDVSTTNEIDKATTLESKDATKEKPKGGLLVQETTNQQKNPTTSEKPTDKTKEQPTTETTENMTVTKSPNDDVSTTNEIDKATTLESKDATKEKPKGGLLVQETTNQQKNPTTSEKPTDKPKVQLTYGTTEKETVTESPVGELTTGIVQPTQAIITKTSTIPTTEQPEEPTTTVLDDQETTTAAPIESTTKATSRPAIYETADVDVRMSTSNPDHHRNKCDAVCMKSVARILTRMNHAGDACEDFYDYACGGDYSDNTLEDHWRKIAAEVEKINVKSPKAQKTFKNFYDKCIDFQLSYNYTERVYEAMQLILRVDESIEAQDNDKTALTNLLTRLVQIDSSPLFDISVDVDKTSQRFVFQLSIGKRFSAIMNNYVTQRKCLFKSKKHSEFSISLFNHLELNELYKVYYNCQKNYTYSNHVIEDALDKFFFEEDFEEWPVDNVEIITEYFKTFSPAEIRKDIATKNFQYMKVAELNYNYRMIDWKLLLQKLVGQDISKETLVQVYFPDFFKKMFKLLADLQSDRKVRDVILAMFAYDLYTNFVLPMPVASPEEFCLKQSVDLMPEIASSFYLKSFTPNDIEEDQKRIENIFDSMKEKLANLIETSDWADAPTQNAMKMKVNNMTLATWKGSLVWKNDMLLDKRMESVNETYDKYSDFKVELNRRKQQMTFNMWNTFCYTDENIWWYFSKPYDTQPAIIYASDLVVIPAGMLFTKSIHLPRYLSLVKLGFSLGKAIGHHFDHIGSKYNISLQNSALASYNESEKCTDYYYKQEETIMDYDGKSIKFKVADEFIGLSIIERFVVQISLNLITSLLNEEKKDYEISYFSNSDFADIFKPEKLFFIALGQEHCTKPNLDDFFLALFESEHLPPALLLNKALIHSKEFSKTFSCREGSGLLKEVTCPAFPELQKDDSFYENYDI